MDLRERQKMRRLKRRRKRRLILAAFLAIILIIVAICMAFSGEKGENSEQNTLPEEQISQTEPEQQGGEEYPTAEKTSYEIVAEMTLEDKIMQLFIVSADGLTGVTNSTIYGNTTKTMLTQKPVGGILYQRGNMETKQQLDAMISNTAKQYSDENGFPLFVIAEENGASSPIADSFGGGVGAMSALTGGEEFADAKAAGKKVAAYMKALKFNVNFAPDLGIGEGTQYFADDAETVASCGVSFGSAMAEAGVVPVYRSFPGKVSSDSVDALKTNEFVPFQTAIAGGAKMIMVSSDRAPVLTGNNEPCYTSKIAVTDMLRTELDFDGVIVTAPLLDDQGAVGALEAGCDMLFMPKDLSNAAAAIKKAVEEGRITEERIDQSVTIIIDLKLSM